jgi:hypothetical protein
VRDSVDIQIGHVEIGNLVKKTAIFRAYPFAAVIPPTDDDSYMTLGGFCLSG